MKKFISISINSLTGMYLIIILIAAATAFSLDLYILLEITFFLAILKLISQKIIYSKKLVFLLILVSFILKILWIVITIDTNPISDFKILFNNIEMLSNGIYLPLEEGEYLHKYQHWKLHTFFYTAIYTLSKSIFFMYFINSLFILFSEMCLFYLVSENEKAFPFYIFLSCPFVFFSKILDPQVIALFLFLVSYLLVKKEISYKNLIITGILLSTGNAFRSIGIFFLIGTIFYLYQNLNLREFFKKSALLTLIFVISSLIIHGPILSDQKSSDSNLYIISSINTGLNKESNGMWNKFDNEKIKSFGDDEKLKKYLLSSIKERISDKEELIKHFISKHINMWKFADFSSIYWSLGDLDNESSTSILFKLKHFLIFFQALYIFTIFKALKSTIFNLSNSINIYPASVFVMLMSLHTLIEVQGRYAFIIFPMILLLGKNIEKTN